MQETETMQDNRSLDSVILAMLTENTGSHFLDSGGAYGRNWQRNKGLTIETLKNTPSATMEIWQANDGTYDITCTVNIFHLLHHALDLDGFCREFNALECGNWDGEYYGTDQSQCDWLTTNGFEAVGGGFNTYNWSSCHSQILQGQELERDGEKYVLLQIHGGCDARGGYTDAKLFSLPHGIEAVLLDHCGFSVSKPDGDYMTLDYYGEWVDQHGSTPSEEYITEFCQLAGDVRTLAGDYSPYY